MSIDLKLGYCLKLFLFKKSVITLLRKRSKVDGVGVSNEYKGTKIWKGWFCSGKQVGYNAREEMQGEKKVYILFRFSSIFI